MYPPDAAAKDSPAVWQAFFIDQVTMSIVIVVLLNSVADVDIGWDGNAHGIAPFVSAYDRSTRHGPDGRSAVCCASCATRGKKHCNIATPMALRETVPAYSSSPSPKNIVRGDTVD